MPTISARATDLQSINGNCDQRRYSIANALETIATALLSAALEKSGFRVRTSKDGQEAYEMVQQVPPDLIVMDIEMPRMDGYELTSLLKSRETYRHIPVVMLTSRAGLKHRQKAEEVGADGFLVKPYREEELLQIVSALLLRTRQ